MEKNPKETEELILQIDTARIFLAEEEEEEEASLVVSLKDITERKRAVEALRESEEKHRYLVEQMMDGITVVDLEERFLFVNPAAEHIFGDPKGGLVGRTLKDFMSTEEFDRIQRQTEERRIHKSSNTYQTEIIRPDGEKRQILVSATPQLDEEGNLKDVFTMIKDLTEHKQAEEALRESEAQYRILIEQSNDAIYLLCEGKFEIINPRFSQMLGVTPEEVREADFNFMDLVAPQSRPLIEERERMRERGEEPPRQYEFTALSKDGREIPVEASVTRILYKEKFATQGILHDITERKKLEAQFRQAQKMEAVGRLAGGVAHDFNNLLTVIGGNTSLAMMTLMPDDPLYHDLTQVQKAAERASNLTRQLLVFSRKQQMQPKVISVNSLIQNMEKMLGRLIGEDINIDIQLAEDLWKVKIDPGQFEQIIMNLCINARDAMRDGGLLSLETKNIILTDDYTAVHVDAYPGSFVVFKISDTGCGMTKDVISNIFDPFFTTKAEGEGTGLGLSTVFGIVKQSEGFINVYSEPGEGTTFKIYLPRTEEDVEQHIQELLPEGKLHGKETILVVEDEEGVRNIAVRTLKRFGYKVIEAENGGEGYLKCRNANYPIDLIITDIIMPEMNGKEFVESIKEICPDVKVLYMSGYTYNIIAKKGIIDTNVSFISKPFESLPFLRKVRETLDKKQRCPAD